MKTFHFGIMGAGNIAANFCRAICLLENCSVRSVSSKSMEKALTFADFNSSAAKEGCMKAYDSYEEMLKCEKLDCVYIATVPSSHYELANTDI